MQKRLRDLNFGAVSDPRVASKVKFELPVLLTAMVAAMTTLARSLRRVEERTAQIAQKHRGWLGIITRIADNTFSKVLGRLSHSQLMSCQHQLVKAEHRRGNLRRPHSTLCAAAIDGKHVATLRWHDLLRVLKLKDKTVTVEQVRTLLAQRFPEAQLCVPKQGEPHALMRIHTVTLISSPAAVCIHQRPIAGDTNEIGAMPALLNELKQAYGRSRLFNLITTDAGNTSQKVAQQIRELGCDYFAQIKALHGDLYLEGRQRLGHRRQSRAHASYSDKQNGQLVTYYAWHYDLGETGYLDWTHSRQLVRVRRVAEDPNTGEVTVGDRYYVSSRNPDSLSAESALEISRGHWRCENCTHWTADAEMHEDQRQLALSRHPHGVLVVAALRMMALAILAITRRMSRMGYSKERPSWSQVAEHYLLQLCGSVLHTEAFDAV
jgi:predicted transposase YbfD/YdcC